MSLKLRINFLILVVATILVGSLSIFTWSTNQLEDINTKRKLGQILLSTSDQLALGKLLLQSDSVEKGSVSSELIDNVFIMQIAIRNNLQNEIQAEQLTNLRHIQIQLPAINLLLESLQARFKNNEELTREDLLNMGQLDSIASEIQETVSTYNGYLNTEEAHITKTTTLYTNIIIGLMGTLVLGIIILSTFGILRPIRTLTQFAKTISQGTYDQSVQIRSRDEFGHLGDTFNTLSAQLNDLITNLEKRIAERTITLEEHSAYLKSSAEVSQIVASITDTEELVSEVVTLIKERFNLYYVGLFLADTEDKWAVLQAGTGKEGKTMLEQNHRLEIGKGMIGWSIANAESRIALDVGKDAVRFENPALPETRSEGALPLRSRGRVLGALTIQSSEEAAFTPEIISTLQTMVDQIAIAIDNAELLAQNEIALEAERKAYGELSEKDWINLLQKKSTPAYISDAPNKAHPIQNWNSDERLQTLQNNLIFEDDNQTAIIPFKIRGRVLGGVKLSKEAGHGDWTEQQLELAEALVGQISVSLESARLLEGVQHRAAQAHLISNSSAKMREKLDVEDVLKTVAREFRNALDIAEAKVWLNADQTQSVASPKSVEPDKDMPHA